jgi:hypothetical protein
MRSRFRVLSVVALAFLLLALPGTGLGANPRPGLGAGAQPSTGPGAPAVVGCAGATAPTLVPGASVLTVGSGDAFSYSGAAGSTVVVASYSDCKWWYSSTTNSILVPLDLPAGATIWQVDAYGYLTGTGTQSWYLLDENTVGGSATSTVDTATSPSGTGVTQATMTFPSGVTLAVGHHWLLFLDGPTSSSAGYVGAVVQYTLPSLSLYPITPIRVFDSRFSRFGGAIANGASRLVNVKDSINVSTGNVAVTNAIPAGAKAISFTLTVTGTVGAGYLAILPGTTTTVTASTVNWSASGQTLAAGGIVQLGSGSAERQVTLVAGGSAGSSTQAILDITGYYR